MLRDTFFITLFFVLLGVAIVYILDIFLFLFWKIWWLDTLVHFGGGFWIGGMALWGYAHVFNDFSSKNSRTLFLLLSVLSAFMIGMAWEVYEVILYPIISSAPDYMLDTTTDLIADVLGATAAGLCFFCTRTRSLLSDERNQKF